LLITSAGTALRNPVGLVVDADGVRDAVHVVEVRHDLNRVVNRGIAPTEAAQAFDVVRPGGGWRMRDLDREVAERADVRLQVGLPIVVGGVLRQFVRGALGTEVVGVRANSVVTVVGARNHDREELSLGARELRRTEHDRPVETHRCRKDFRVERHRLDDVEDLPRARYCCVVLALELAGCLVFLDQPEVGHRAILS
jgi:hypothetical protein